MFLLALGILNWRFNDAHVTDYYFYTLCKIVERMGFHKSRQKGSHIRYVHGDGRKATIARR